MADSHRPAATLTLTRGPDAGRRFDVGAAPVTIGRQDQCEVQVPGTWVSRRHARLAWTGTGYIVEDLGSTNGTFVNGERVSGAHALQSGDRLQLGEQVEFAFEARMPAPVRAEAALPGMAPSQAQAPPSQPKRSRAWVWALGLLGLLVIVAAGVGIYYLLSDNGPQLADLPILEAVLPEPTSTPTPIPPTPTPTATPTPTPTATPTPTPVPPTATPTPTPVPPTATPKPEPLVLQGEAFEADVQDSCSVDVAITEVIGDGLRIKVLSGSIPIRQGGLTIWCYGAKHTWMGNLTYGDYTFDSDDNSPLQFILDRVKGYIYLSGTGRVTQPNGKTVELP
jgi:predicted component of type VI protein secretion system